MKLLNIIINNNNKLQARKNLVNILQAAVTKRRKKREATQGLPKTDMLDNLLDAEDEIGKKLDDEEIIDTLVMYLNAGHESSGHVTMWATLLLQSHPEYLKIAKVAISRIFLTILKIYCCLAVF